MGVKLKFDEAAVKEIVGMYKAKKTVKEIAKTKGTSPATVRSYLRKAKIYKTWRKKRGKKTVAVRQATKLSLEAINEKFMAAKAELKRLEKLMKTTVKREEMKFKKLKKKIGI